MIIVNSRDKPDCDRLYSKIKEYGKDVSEVIVCSESEYMDIKKSAARDGTFKWKINTLTNFKIKFSYMRGDVTVRLVSMRDYLDYKRKIMYREKHPQL